MFNVDPADQPPPGLAAPPATVTGVSVVSSQKKNRKGKNVGKPLIGYEITFGTAMNQQSLASPSNYIVDSVVVTKRTKKKPAQTRLTPIAFSITNVSSNSATLSPSGSPFLQKAGMITLDVSSPGIESTAGAPLASRYVIEIARRGKWVLDQLKAHRADAVANRPNYRPEPANSETPSCRATVTLRSDRGFLQ